MGISADEQSANYSSRCHHLIAIIVACPRGRSRTEVGVAREDTGLQEGHERRGGNGACHLADHERAARLSEQAHTIAFEFRSTFGHGPAGYTLAGASRAEGDPGHTRTLLDGRSTEEEKPVAGESDGMAETNARDSGWSESKTAFLLLPLRPKDLT
jgi:hypothetical protein